MTLKTIKTRKLTFRITSIVSIDFESKNTYNTFIAFAHFTVFRASFTFTIH